MLYNIYDILYILFDSLCSFARMQLSFPSLFQGNRDERENVDVALAKQDAQVNLKANIKTTTAMFG